MTRLPPDPERGAEAARKLKSLGVKGILVKAGELGYIMQVTCRMPECFCPEELGGAWYFEPVAAELTDWMPTHEHFPRAKREGAIEGSTTRFLPTATLLRTQPASVQSWMDVFNLDDMKFSPTAALFEGLPRAGVGISVFVVRTPPGKGVDIHVHPYSETFVLLEGSGRWTAGDDAVDLHPNQMLVVPPETPHGFRNTGEEPLLVVSVHESGTLDQTFLGRDPD